MKRLLLFLAWVWLLLAESSTAMAAAEPLPEDVYWGQLEETRDLVGNLGGELLSVAQPRLHAAAEQWASVTAVILADGTTLPVDHSWLVAQLRAEPPKLERLQEQLDTLLDVRDEWNPADGELDFAAWDDILARPEFQWPESRTSPLTEWFMRLLSRLLDLLPSGLNLSGFRWLLTIVGALALAAVLYFALRGVLSGMISEDELDPDALEGGRPLTSAAAMKRAQELSAGGDYRSAVRYLYLSSLLLLEERGLLRYDRSLTNREYLRSVSQHPHLVSILGDVVEVFDRVWYGYQPLDQAAYDHYAARVAELKQQR